MFFLRKKFLWVVFIFLFLLVLLQRENIFRFSQTSLFFLFKKPAIFFNFLGSWLEEKVSFLVSIGDLKEDREKLFQENLFLKGEIVGLKEVLKENEELRKELDLKQKEKIIAQASLVVACPFSK